MTESEYYNQVFKDAYDAVGEKGGHDKGVAAGVAAVRHAAPYESYVHRFARELYEAAQPNLADYPWLTAHSEMWYRVVKFVISRRL